MSEHGNVGNKNAKKDRPLNKSVHLRLSEAEYLALHKQAKAEGFRGVSAFIRSKLFIDV